MLLFRLSALVESDDGGSKVTTECNSMISSSSHIVALVPHGSSMYQMSQSNVGPSLLARFSFYA
jgi:hypothetical protein